MNFIGFGVFTVEHLILKRSGPPLRTAGLVAGGAMVAAAALVGWGLSALVECALTEKK